MTRFYGHVGYAETRVTSPGVHKEVFTEYPYFGDVTQDLRKLQQTEHLNDDLILQNIITIVGDKMAFDNYMNIRYVKWGGAYWTVNYVEVRRPRLILRFGGLYRGTTAEAPPDAG